MNSVIEEWIKYQESAEEKSEIPTLRTMPAAPVALCEAVHPLYPDMKCKLPACHEGGCDPS